jgi:hypothetical protein
VESPCGDSPVMANQGAPRHGTAFRPPDPSDIASVDPPTASARVGLPTPSRSGHAAPLSGLYPDHLACAVRVLTVFPPPPLRKDPLNSGVPQSRARGCCGMGPIRAQQPRPPHQSFGVPPPGAGQVFSAADRVRGGLRSWLAPLTTGVRDARRDQDEGRHESHDLCRIRSTRSMPDPVYRDRDATPISLMCNRSTGSPRPRVHRPS